MRRIVTQRERVYDFRYLMSSLGPEYDSMIADTKVPDGGFSYNPNSGQKPSKRYMVAEPDAEQVVPADEFSRQHVQQHYDTYGEKFADPEMFQGAWHNPKDHMVYLDASKQYGDLPTALSAGAKNKQLAIFDNQSGNSIDVPNTRHARIAAQTPNAVHPGIDAVTQKWNSQFGTPKPAVRTPAQSMQEADHYDSSPHSPNDPQMQKSYQSLIHSVGKQYNDLRSQGIKFTPSQSGGEPYADSNAMRADLAKGNLNYLPTGTAGDLPAGHPMAQSINTVDGPMMANDAFRAVHDAMGHGYGASFGPVGEQQAWANHRSTLPADSHAALWSETRGQNVSTNYGQSMRDANGQMLPPEQQPPLSARPFAEQKIVNPGQYA